MLATILATAAAALGVGSPLDHDEHAQRRAALDATTKAADAELAEAQRRARVIVEAAQIKHDSAIEDATARVARRNAAIEIEDARAFHDAFPGAFALWRTHRTDASPIASLIAETREAVRLHLAAELDPSALVVALATAIGREDALAAFGSGCEHAPVQAAQRFMVARGEVAQTDALRALESALAAVPDPFTHDRLSDPAARDAFARSRLVNINAGLRRFDSEHETAARAALARATVAERDARFPHGFIVATGGPHAGIRALPAPGQGRRVDIE